MEDIRHGQHIEAFSFEVWEGPGPATGRDFFGTMGWREIAKGTTIGWKKLLRFPTVTAKWIRVRVLKSRSDLKWVRLRARKSRSDATNSFPKTFGLYLDPGR